MVSSEDTADREKLIPEILREYQAEKPEYGEMLKKVWNMMHSGGYPQENEAPRDLLKELQNADEVSCEVPFCWKDEKKLWNGVMDLIYEKNGQWHIVDYKTNAEVLRLNDQYENQLKSYIRAFEKMTGQTADAFIYHISI